MRILLVPDGLWGDLSGNRSAKYLIKALNLINFSVAVYASKKNYTELQHEEIKNNDCLYFPKSDYNYTQQIFRKKADLEFAAVIDDYNPDFVFYFGTIKNKISIDFCIKNNIKYLYLALTTEYYCIKNYAGLKNAPCYKCLKGSLTAPLLNKCMTNKIGILNYIKDKSIELRNRKRIINAHYVFGYSQNQIDTLVEYGVDRDKTIELPVFFDPNSTNQIQPQAGEKFLIAGEILSDKGSFLIPDIIKKTKNVKYKLIIKKNVTNDFIKANKLELYIENGTLEIIDYLKTHELFLKEIARSKGVLIPSYYPTTGEFTMIEALMFGKPVVVFDIGMHQNFFIDKQNGMVAKTGDVNEYYKKIELLNNDKKLYKNVSVGAKNLFDRSV